MLKTMWAKKRIENMIDVTLDLVTAEHLSTAELQTFAQIVGHTSKSDYKKSGNGWHFQDKVDELSKPEMMFLVIRAAAGTNATFAPMLQTDIIAYAAFRLDCDEKPYQERTLMYLWEVHVSAQFRGKGIASFLIRTVESIATAAGITKIMLTVFTCNEHAAAVYYNLGYVKDAASPAGLETRKGVKKAPYMLMSKDWWDPGYIPQSPPIALEPQDQSEQSTVLNDQTVPPTSISLEPSFQSEESFVSDDQTSPSSPFSFELPYHTKDGLSHTSSSSSLSFDLPLR
jgi:ribosomal protein S18 acetylase RimI-like enzyme